MESIIAQVGTWLLGISAVASVVGVVVKYLKVVKEIGDVVAAILDANEDGKLDNDEILSIIEEAKEVKKAIKDLK